MKVTANRNEDSGHIELGVEDGGHFVALATMPIPQFDATVENLKSASTTEDNKAA